MPDNPKYPTEGNRGMGRRKGATNKIPSVIQQGIFNALTQSKGDVREATKFFTQMRDEHPVQFMQIVGRLLPQQIKADVTGNEQKTWTIKLIDTRQDHKQIKQAEAIECE